MFFYSENNICVLILLWSFSRLLLLSMVIYTMSKLGGGGVHLRHVTLRLDRHFKRSCAFVLVIGQPQMMAVQLV